MTKLVAILVVILTIGVAGDSTAQTSAASVVRLPNEIVYKGLPGTPQHVTLFGDPTKPGLYVGSNQIFGRHKGHAPLASGPCAHRAHPLGDIVLCCWGRV